MDVRFLTLFHVRNRTDSVMALSKGANVMTGYWGDKGKRILPMLPFVR